MRGYILAIGLLLALTSLCAVSVHADDYFQSKEHCQTMQREQGHIDQLNREDRRRTEDYRRQLECDHEARHRANQKNNLPSMSE
jgi:hypothetical protein